MPLIFCRMKPSPPNRPAPKRFVKAIERSMLPVAQRKALRSARIVLPRSSIGKILPAIGFASAMCARGAWQRKTDMKSDSPARNLRISPFIRPPCILAWKSIPSLM